MAIGTSPTPQEIGFVLGAMGGLLWLLLYEKPDAALNDRAVIWLLIMLCGGIGAGVGWLIGTAFERFGF
jgi:hypothetical protein